MSPKINGVYKNTYCDLGFWTLNYKYEKQTSNKFAIGQNFLRKYGILYNFDLH